ncbi:phosphotransferase [Cellulomonas pakistanensis]|uniref:Aminoglycoside phosphotransferase domain-containing protein n=1 Tax=Cellulomonas pakistanensis TaxID=992287 RepID=A0A919U5E7_9CELL|nr:phosphotransferase [Cellulomonas pakistanensis]GIG35215.1 hypothetical protein Cpa01nite_05960 [Cellulomonas pakistanensis]
MSALAEVGAVAAAHGLRLRRAWPRGAEHLLLELVPDGGGSAVAGQWFADAGRAARVAAGTGDPARAAGRVVLQPRGADRRLPALARVLARPGARLVAHRPERRAVVRLGDGSYAKVVRSAAVADLVASAAAAAATGLRVPTVLDVDEVDGVVTTRALPGRTLHALLADPAVDPAPAARELGRALAVLHASPLPPGARVHDAAAEAAVLARWRGLARAHGVPVGEAPAPPPAGAGPLVPVHRDLHDKQVLVDDRGRVGLLDFDLAAAGEAALDVANLLVHLELRAHQGVCAPDRAVAVRVAVLDGYRPAPRVSARIPAYEALTRARLAAVYGFRPGSPAAVLRWGAGPEAAAGGPTRKDSDVHSRHRTRAADPRDIAGGLPS